MSPGRIIRLRGADHGEVQELLPWYVTGRLDPADHAAVEAHLDQCAECRAETAVQRRLSEEVGRLPFNVELGWRGMRRRLKRDAELKAVRRDLARKVRLGAPWLGWAVAAGLLAFGIGLRQPSVHLAPYHALGAGRADSSGNVLVMFKPDSSEAALRQTLAASDARMVDGPTAAGAYLIHVPSTERATALTRLRADPAVTAAQPIDGEAGP